MSSDSKDPTIAPDYLAKQYKLAEEAAEAPKDSALAGDHKTDVKARNAATRYYAVSTPKLVVLSMATFGLYDVYWFYKNWVEIKRRERANIIPWARALFSVFYAYSCFDRVRKSAANTGVDVPAWLKWNGIGYLACQALVNLPDSYWMLSLGAVLFLVQANRVMGDINADTGGDEQPRGLQGGDWLLVAFGGLLLLGSLIPESWIPQPQ